MGRIAGVTAAQTRERLLDAAASVFEREGYVGATVAQIAREAGLTTGAIYAHYATKADLLVDAVRAHKDRATAGLFPPGTRVDVTSILVTLGNRLGDRDREATALLAEALLAARRDAELAQVLAGALGEREGLMAALVAKGQSAGELTPDVSPEVAARFALMLGLGALLVRTLDMPPADPADWNAFIRRFVGAFAGSRSPAGTPPEGRIGP